ncbi:hypothetical protein T4B_422 [Trichinella pseudospiralis]|uniref:Uncharacterized protein n=1 Tax=Trichinella pseudospiralis TaxID=6337 RepID=A0A0V0Y8W3_TRIPS|nr:hypothetical protein T4E_9460 [Trichinella pseudospiralis]KRY66125.1 hypothetical protein T4A_4316 [Trichinella pseudospiralis]KRZ20076.1 hypothetical protein T4B_422 [Trichinella pseudospiralis]KRZ23267.1 hypothetical protein T4C_1282 [Trichinella pseudospiralis]KRZ38332.1 hypothetical protein T4C_12814 [Trichinella pseudospiralis]
MASLKREAEKRGKAAANTGPSTSNEERVNSGAKETNEPAGGSGLLQSGEFEPENQENYD